MLNPFEILQTINMIKEDKLDIRTITMGISLLDCITDNSSTTVDKVYDKIMRSAKDLVRVGEDITTEFGIPIINKRIAVTPISIVGKSCGQYVKLAGALDRAAHELGVNFIGGYSALVHKDYTKREFLDTIPTALANTKCVCASVGVATTRSGINMDACLQMGEVIKKTAQLTAHDNGIGAAKLVVFANPVDDNPFMAGAFHGMGEGDLVINVGVSGPGVVKRAIEKLGKDADLGSIAEEIKRTAFKITRMGQLVANESSKRLGASFGIVDLSLAPTPAIGDSVADILTEMGLEVCGVHGTTAALALLNDAVKKGGVMASSYVGGLSGAFIPVSEDDGMVKAIEKGALNIEKLEAMTAVCSVGLDMVCVPGDTKSTTIAAILADEMAIGVVNGKTTALRIIPVPNKTAGENVEFGGLLGHSPILKLSEFSSDGFVLRGGRVPAPLHSLKN